MGVRACGNQPVAILPKSHNIPSPSQPHPIHFTFISSPTFWIQSWAPTCATWAPQQCILVCVKLGQVSLIFWKRGIKKKYTTCKNGSIIYIHKVYPFQCIL